MKWTLPFLAVVCVTLAAVPNKERAFSLFSVVTFPNNECTTAESTALQGICQTGEECGESGGTQSGNCASGFGVCCFHTTSVAGEITNNLTYIQNTGYPSTTGATAATAGVATVFTVDGGPSICQVRLDFDDVELQQPSNTGVCTATTGDQLTVISPSTTLPGINDLCGTLSGQHMYIHNDGADPAATITVTLGSSTTAGRKWKIKVTQIECDSMSRAPEGCLQYYTGSTGTISSFNGASTTNAMIINQEYSACIRTEAGMCSFSVTQARITTTPDAFDLVGVDLNPALSTVGNAGTGCATTYIVIPTTNADIPEPKFCGSILSSKDAQTSASAVISDVKPFSIGVVSLAALIATTEGFEVNYSQIPCSN